MPQMFPFYAKRPKRSKNRPKYKTEVGIIYSEDTQHEASSVTELEQSERPETPGGSRPFSEADMESKTRGLNPNEPPTTSAGTGHLDPGRPYGMVKSLRDRFLSFGETSMEADVAQLRNSSMLSQRTEDPNQLINKGTVKHKAEEFKKKNQLIKSVTDKPPPPRQFVDFEGSSSLQQRSQSDGTLNAAPVTDIRHDEDILDTWDVIDPTEEKDKVKEHKDNDLREVQVKLDNLPNLPRERGASIMIDAGLYQDLTPVNEEHDSKSLGSQHSYSTSTACSSSSSFSTSSSMSTSSAEPGKSRTLNTEHPLDAIEEESFSASLSLSREHSLRRPRKEGLWQHQKHIMESGILDKMTPAETKLQEALFEIITSEESNLKSLIILVKHFKASYEGKPTPQQMKARKLSSGDVETEKSKSKAGKKQQVLGKYESDKLFFNVEMIKECSEKFLARVDALQKDQLKIVNFLNIVSENATTMFGKAVVKYCKNMSHQNDILKHLLANEIWFAAKTAQLEKDKRLNDKTFKSFLVVPLSRICHIPLLLEKVVKLSSKLTDDYSVEIHADAQRALELMKGIASQCNKETQQLDDLAARQNILVNIQSKVIFKDIKLSLIQDSRRFYFESSVMDVQATKGRSLFKYVETNLYLFLFTDMMLITKPVQGLYEVLDVVDTQPDSLLVQDAWPDEITDAQKKERAHLSSSHKAKGALIMVFHQTKLGRGEQKKNIDNPNCFQNEIHYFVFPSRDARNQFVDKLKEAHEEYDKLYGAGAVTQNQIRQRVFDPISGAVTDVPLRHSPNPNSSLKKDRRKSSIVFNTAPLVEHFANKKLVHSDEGEPDLNDAKFVATTSKAAFTPLLHSRSNLKKFSSSIQLNNSQRLSFSSDEEDFEGPVKSRTTSNTPIGLLDEDFDDENDDVYIDDGDDELEQGVEFDDNLSDSSESEEKDETIECDDDDDDDDHMIGSASYELNLD